MSTQEETRPTRWVPRLSFVVLVLCAVAVIGMYVRGGRTSLGVVLAGGLPVTILVALVAAAIGWRHRRWLRLGLVLGILVSQAPLLDHALDDDASVDEDPPRIRVATLNTMHAGPTDEELVTLAKDQDVLALQEWDPQRTEDLTAALGSEWRVAARDHDDYIGAGVAVWVRTPWQVGSTDPLRGRQPGSALHLANGRQEVMVVGTRLQNPAFRAAERWGEGLDALRQASDGSDGPVIVMGDLNAPPSAVAFRELTRDTGLKGCTAQLGLGFPGTWGRDRGASFAPVPIDHVLTRDAPCTDLEITRVRGSDHRALSASVALN